MAETNLPPTEATTLNQSDVYNSCLFPILKSSRKPWRHEKLLCSDLRRRARTHYHDLKDHTKAQIQCERDGIQFYFVLSETSIYTTALSIKEEEEELMPQSSSTHVLVRGGRVSVSPVFWLQEIILLVPAQ